MLPLSLKLCRILRWAPGSVPLLYNHFPLSVGGIPDLLLVSGNGNGCYCHDYVTLYKVLCQQIGERAFPAGREEAAALWTGDGENCVAGNISSRQICGWPSASIHTVLMNSANSLPELYQADSFPVELPDEMWPGQYPDHSSMRWSRKSS